EEPLEPLTLAPGDTLSFSYRVNNEGTAHSEATDVTVYLAELGTVDGLLATNPIPEVEYGTSWGVIETAIIPNDLPAGTYHLHFEV
ncbi:MAG: CARDB domain-containing protein, partial [Acidobacteriota bacterium]|nr:CARDB domain-containing protein [Acidobacteriota bacterium]